MKSLNFTFKDELGEKIQGYRWNPEGKPKAIIQISHGMTEHAGRYKKLAEYLTSKGYLCIAEDHHGHGYTAPSIKHLGILPSDWKEIANDIHILSQMIQDEFPDLPVFLIGNSWGSYLAQYYMETWGKEIKGCILLGTSGAQPKLKITLMLTAVLSFFRRNHPSEFMTKRTFGSFNQYFEPTRTKFDWLSRDTAAVDKFIRDPRCGFIPSNGFYRELAKLLKYIWDPANEKQIPSNLPIYIMAGKKDSVSVGTRLIEPLIDRYHHYGFKNVSTKYYPEARHDILHEINKDDVFRDIFTWLKRKLI
jgi:alpha-beta hydrolase superfamily lysophospholipase